MRIHFWFALALLWVVVSQSPQAGTQESKTEEGRVANYGVTVEQPWVAHGLSEGEWQRYLTIMAGPRGQWSPDLEPVAVLGIEARNSGEQTHFARLYIDQQKARVDKEVAFQQRINQLRQNDGSALPVAQKPADKADHYALFVNDSACDGDCDRWLSRGVALVKSRGITLHIYVANASSDDAIRAWAARQSLPRQAIFDGQIVLHADRGQYKTIASKMRDASHPMLVALRGSAVTKVEF